MTSHEFQVSYKSVYGGLLLLVMTVSTYFVRASLGGLPVRIVLLLCAISFMAIYSPSLLLQAVKDCRYLIFLLVYFAACAAFSSIINDSPAETIVGQLVEIHLQAIVSLVAFYVMSFYLGPSRFIKLFSIPIAFSVLIAVLQFAGFNPAWSLYDIVAAMQPQSTEELEFFDPHYRALGLSYSPVHLGTQICLVFALCFGYFTRKVGQRYIFKQRGQTLVAIAVFCFIAAALVSGNRSPLLGIFAFITVYLFRCRPALAILLLCLIPAFLALQPLLIEMLNATGIRAFNTENSSGEGRAALRAFGILLFLDQPFGYGLAFDSTQHWWKYWNQIQSYENAEAITIHALHNFYLVTLNKHGILMILSIVWLIPKILRNATPLMGFIPYAVHCYYHNAGPTNGDFMFWFIVPVFVMHFTANSRQPRPTRFISAPANSGAVGRGLQVGSGSLSGPARHRASR